MLGNAVSDIKILTVLFRTHIGYLAKKSIQSCLAKLSICGLKFAECPEKMRF